MAENFKYPTSAIRELAGVYMLAVFRINKEIEEMDLDYTKTWDLINQEYDSIKQEVSEDTVVESEDLEEQPFEEWTAHLIKNDSEWTFVHIDASKEPPMFYLEAYGDWLEVTSEEISRISVFMHEIKEEQ